jgi:hypothetical protein
LNVYVCWNYEPKLGMDSQGIHFSTWSPPGSTLETVLQKLIVLVCLLALTTPLNTQSLIQAYSSWLKDLCQETCQQLGNSK